MIYLKEYVNVVFSKGRSESSFFKKINKKNFILCCPDKEKHLYSYQEYLDYIPQEEEGSIFFKIYCEIKELKKKGIEHIVQWDDDYEFKYDRYFYEFIKYESNTFNYFDKKNNVFLDSLYDDVAKYFGFLFSHKRFFFIKNKKVGFFTFNPAYRDVGPSYYNTFSIVDFVEKKIEKYFCLKDFWVVGDIFFSAITKNRDDFFVCFRCMFLELKFKSHISNKISKEYYSFTLKNYDFLMKNIPFLKKIDLNCSKNNIGRLNRNEKFYLQYIF